jgi:hypothetical protein
MRDGVSPVDVHGQGTADGVKFEASFDSDRLWNNKRDVPHSDVPGTRSSRANEASTIRINRRAKSLVI